MSKLVSIVIPYAPYHTALVEQAIAAARSQSLPCDVIPVHDVDGRGAGWARNRGIALSDTPFVLFLDADDTLRPDAIERMLSVYVRGRYVYCDDWSGDSLHQTSDMGYYEVDDPWWHSITTLVPTVYAKAIGGFNEELTGLEDKDFFYRLQASGVCGVRCPHPLLYYSYKGMRSRGFKNSPEYSIIHNELDARYSGRAKAMCNCGATVGGYMPEGKQEGDILVEALYTPMQMGGPVTGRLYPRPRGHENNQIWVNRDDVDSSAGRTRWRVVMTADPNAAPAVDDVMAYAAQAVAR